jgi:hypothetical protein
VGHYQAAGQAGKAQDPEKKKAEITLALEHFNKVTPLYIQPVYRDGL